MAELHEEIRKNIDIITLGIIEEQERKGTPLTPLEAANIAVCIALRDAANWLQATLADDPEFRYSMSLLLHEQADILAQPKD